MEVLVSINKVISKKAYQRIAKDLAAFFANSYILYVKTQNFHWNVEDPRFYALHKFFEEQYEDFEEAIDVIAERIRGLGAKTPGSLAEILKLATIKESGNNLSADEMIKTLIRDHEAIIEQIRPQIHLDQEDNDEGTADLLIDRLRFHEKTLWMLKSHLSK